MTDRKKRDKKEIDRAGAQEQKLEDGPVPARHRTATGGVKKG